MPTHPTREGEVAYDAANAGKPCKTWYRVVGDVENSKSLPVIALHGGPGSGHEPLTSIIDLYEKFGIPVIFYDQVGCGRSTHFREKMGDASFWTFDLFIAELENLIDHLGIREKGFFVLGQSWGGMLAGAYASRRPVGLKKAVICGAPASFPLFVKGSERLREQLPADVREILQNGDHDSPEYKKASAEFYAKHLCRVDPMPEPVQQAFKNLQDDPTPYHTMQGPSELVITGTLKDWDGSEDAKNINVDTLLLNGRYDEVTELCTEPWFRNIPRIKWVVFENASHMPHWEERERYMQVVASFLTGHQ